MNDQESRFRFEFKQAPAHAELESAKLAIVSKRPDPPELTALHAAIEAKNPKEVKKILRQGVDVNGLHSNFDNGFPLVHALRVNDKKIIQLLLEAGADPNCDNYLADCIEEDSLGVAKLLIQHGADVEGPPPTSDGAPYETNLIRAIRMGNYAFVKLLLEAGADANRHDENDESPLLIARLDKDRRLTKLIDAHVSEAERDWVEERFSDRYAAKLKLDGEIYAAIHAGQVERVMQLFQETHRPLDTPLAPQHLLPLEEAMSAYFNALGATRPKSKVTTAAEFLSNNDPNHDDPAVIAMVSMIESLVDLGAPVDNGIYAPPLYAVVSMSNRHLDLFMRMLEMSSSADARTTMDQETPLACAVVEYDVEKTRILLAHGADPNARNRQGESVLQRARSREKYQGPNPCVPILIEAGAMD